MRTFSKRLLAGAVTAALLAPMSAMATNGMNLEGYGPIALGMGGASYAYDNGTAAMMNNPATLGLMASGTSRLDVALGFLGPDVKTTVSGYPEAKSSADAFYMPAIGWVKNSGKYTYGVGMFAQGGMGTEYAANSALALGSGDKVMSQVSVGRIMAPLVVNVNSKLKVGGSLDFVWANMDLKMAVPISQFNNLITASTSAWNTQLGGLGGAGATWGRFDFADKSDFTGAAKGTGWAAKLGLVYEVSQALTIGATYHSKTSLSDLEAPATLSAGNTSGQLGAFHGNISVKDFQWPETYGVGLAYRPSGDWMIAADYKHIGWEAVMKNFKMTFNTTAQGDLSVAMPQNWKDQNVFELGAAYRATDKTTLRFGVNLTDNPIPDSTVNALFPAIVKNSYQAGIGYAIDKQQGVNFAVSFAPKVTVTNTAASPNYTISHSQLSWQLMYSHSF